jgi:hypothetical protein
MYKKLDIKKIGGFMKKLLLVTSLIFIFFIFSSYTEVLANDSFSHEVAQSHENAKLEKTELSKNVIIRISDTENSLQFDFDFSEIQNSIEAYNAIIEYGRLLGLDIDLEYSLFDAFCAEMLFDYEFIINNYIIQINEIVKKDNTTHGFFPIITDSYNVLDQDFYSESINSSSSSSSGDQARYYDIGTELPQRADYSCNNLMIVAKKGDILHDAAGFFGLTGHSAIVEGKFYSTTQNQYYIRVIEAVYPGNVSRGVLDCERLNDRDGSLYRVTGATAEDIDNAVAFAISQLGKYYWLDFAKNTSADESNWYCSELVWAAYMNQGIDIEVTGILDKKPGIWPMDIVNSDETYLLTLTLIPSC